jgi:uncharacterized membrane protein YeiH
MVGPAGVIAGRSCVITSAADSLQIRLFGRGAHGSMPQAAIDPVVMASATVLRVQGIVARELAPTEAAVVTVGSLQAGTKEMSFLTKRSSNSTSALGMLTGIGGGMMRDVLVSEIPTVLRADVYAVAALTGATVVAVAHVLHISAFAATIAGGTLCFALRFGAIRYGWHLPAARAPRRSSRDPMRKGERDRPTSRGS